MNAAQFSSTLFIQCLLWSNLLALSRNSEPNSQTSNTGSLWSAEPGGGETLLGKWGGGGEVQIDATPSNSCTNLLKRSRHRQGFILCSAVLIIYIVVLFEGHVMLVSPPTKTLMPPSVFRVIVPTPSSVYHIRSLFILQCVLYRFDKWKSNIADSATSVEKYSALQTYLPR